MVQKSGIFSRLCVLPHSPFGSAGLYGELNQFSLIADLWVVHDLLRRRRRICWSFFSSIGLYCPVHVPLRDDNIGAMCAFIAFRDRCWDRGDPRGISRPLHSGLTLSSSCAGWRWWLRSSSSSHLATAIFRLQLLVPVAGKSLHLCHLRALHPPGFSHTCMLPAVHRESAR